MGAHLAEYETYRQHLTKLQQAAVDWGMNHKHEFLRAAKKFGMLGAKDTLVFDDESELSILMDGFIYETVIGQQTITSAFLNQYSIQNSIDRQSADAMRHARFGLFRIETITSSRAEIQLKALVPGISDATLTNVALSKTGHAGLIIACRVLRLPELSTTSGVIFPFKPVREQRIVREWQKQQGLQRYAHIFRLSRNEPITTLFR